MTTAGGEELLASQSDLQAIAHERGNGQGSCPTPMPSAYKGKQKAASSNSDRPTTMFHLGEGRRKEWKSDWIIDEDRARSGADAWIERDRVVLVLGRKSICSRRGVLVQGRSSALTEVSLGPTPDSLSPMLYNPQYAETLIIIALSTPSPGLAQLAAQTAAERTTYPIIQLIDIAALSKGNPAQALPCILDQAAKKSAQWRSSLRSAPPSRMSWMGAGSRRSSTDSMASIMPPITPPMRSRASLSASAPQIYSRRSSEASTDSQQPAEISGKRSSLAPSYRDTSRPPVTNRKSSFFGLAKSTTDTRSPPPASPFDAVLHILPHSAEFAPNRALQEMLQSSVLLTSAVVPLLAKRNMSSGGSGKAGAGSQTDLAPISLVHVIPPNSPHALPPVVENFVLSLVPKFQQLCERDMSAYVVSQSAWLHPAEREMMSGGDLLFFGGARVKPTHMPDGSTRVSKRAYIPYWPHQGPPMAVAPNPDFTRADYSTLVPLAQPAPARPGDKATQPQGQGPAAGPRRKTANRSPPTSRPATRHHRSGLSQSIIPADLEDVNSLHTPDLDHAPSSASSQSHDAQTPHASTYGSEMSSPTLTMEDGQSQLQMQQQHLHMALPPAADRTKKPAGGGERVGGGGFGSFVKRFGKKK